MDIPKLWFSSEITCIAGHGEQTIVRLLSHAISSQENKKRLINIISYYDIIFEMNNPIIWQLQLLEWLGKKLTLSVYNWLIIVFYKTKTWRYEVDLKWKSRKPAERDVFGPTLRTLMWVPVPGTTGPINQPGTSVTQFQCYKTSSH